MDEKPCSECNLVKSLQDFHRNRASPDGHMNTCKVCRALQFKARNLKFDRPAYGPREEYDSIFPVASAPPGARSSFWRELASHLTQSLSAFENDPSYRRRMVQKYVGRA